jgi:hypothetical protein
MTHRITTALFALWLPVTGCSAAKSALGVLSPKPPEQHTQVTVIANSPGASATPEHHSSRTATIVESALAGAVAGAAVVYLIHKI